MDSLELGILSLRLNDDGEEPKDKPVIDVEPIVIIGKSCTPPSVVESCELRNEHPEEKKHRPKSDDTSYSSSAICKISTGSRNLSADDVKSLEHEPPCLVSKGKTQKGKLTQTASTPYSLDKSRHRMPVEHDEIVGYCPESASDYTLSPDSGMGQLSPLSSASEEGGHFQDFKEDIKEFEEILAVKIQGRFKPILPKPGVVQQIADYNLSHEEQSKFKKIEHHFASSVKKEQLSYIDQDKDSLIAIGVSRDDFCHTLALLQRMKRECCRDHSDALLEKVLNNLNNFVQTPLYIAVSRNIKDGGRFVEALMDYGADPNIRCYSSEPEKISETVLHCAARKGNCYTVKQLLQHRPNGKSTNVEALNGDGQTALHVAVMYHGTPIKKTSSSPLSYVDCIGVIEELRRNGAQHHQKDKNGKSTLNLLTEKASLQLMKAFFDKVPSHSWEFDSDVETCMRSLHDMCNRNSKSTSQRLEEVKSCVQYMCYTFGKEYFLKTVEKTSKPLTTISLAGLCQTTIPSNGTIATTSRTTVIQLPTAMTTSQASNPLRNDVFLSNSPQLNTVTIPYNPQCVSFAYRDCSVPRFEFPGPEERVVKGFNNFTSVAMNPVPGYSNNFPSSNGDIQHVEDGLPENLQEWVIDHQIPDHYNDRL